MAKKENKGGRLTNEQVEKDNRSKGRSDTSQSYVGLQDTGDKKLRQFGTDVQRKDGLPDDDIKKDN
ncbi:MAG TPA: hypothetical protein VFS22_07200 [Flavisolibacter sp.]|nr:hypothetical protein [Flavisolibacter sp.]